MYHIYSLLSKIALQIKLSYQIASECTVQFHCFQKILCKSEYRIKQWLNASITGLIFTFFLIAVLTSFQQSQNARVSVLVFIFLCNSKSFEIPSQCMLYIHCFHLLLSAPNRLKYRHNACFFHFFSVQAAVSIDTDAITCNTWAQFITTIALD